MITASKAERILRIISQAWGPADNEGYCFFPWIDRTTNAFHTAEFEWPKDYSEIIGHIVDKQEYDLYWCPMIFDGPVRRAAAAHEEYALWADLDEADPRLIEEKWKPSVAWQTSPGRYQALWLLEDPDAEDLVDASVRGNENQRMSYMVGADPSGWDTTQLLRLPGMVNHKPDYGLEGAQGKLLWSRGPKYRGEDFNRLPEVAADEEPAINLQVMEDLDGVDRADLIARLSGKMPKVYLDELAWSLSKISERYEDKSNRLFVIMRALADAGCSVVEIVAAIQPTAWNKFRGREEYLVREAEKAHTKAQVKREKAEEESAWKVTLLHEYTAKAKSPTWLVKGLFTRGSVGFIAGEPKTRKSWCALDLAMSVALESNGTGARFLNHFPIANPGAVLYVSLEDGDFLFKQRQTKIWQSKMRLAGSRLVVGDGPSGVNTDPDQDPRMYTKINIVHDTRFNLKDPNTFVQLRRHLAKGFKNRHGAYEPYALVVIDTFLRAAGSLDINKSDEVMPVLSEMTRIARESGTTILFVHHFNKTKTDGPTRGGSRMMGSQAIHSWVEEAIYVRAYDDNKLIFENESKVAIRDEWTFDLDPSQRTWHPHLHDTPTVQNLDFTGVTEPRKYRPGPDTAREVDGVRLPRTEADTYESLKNLPPGVHTTREVVGGRDWSPGYTHRNLRRLTERGLVVKEGTLWRIA